MSQERGMLRNANIVRNCNLLLSEDKKKRKNALEEIQKELFDGDVCLVSEEELGTIYNQIDRNLLKTLSDDSEICRELGVSLIQGILSYLPIHEKYLSVVIPYLVQRIGCQEIIETSEEIRLLLVKLLKMTVKKYGSLLSPYLNEIIQILSKTIVDPYPTVKKESCECVSDVAVLLSKQFHLQSETVVKPILKILSHQHFKVRAAGVNALSDVIRHGNSKSVDEVIGPLAERLFDQNATVRLAVAHAVGNWFINFPDRYSFFHKFIPLLLTCLMDEIPDVRKVAHDLWVTAGRQYEAENEEELKEIKDYVFSSPLRSPPIERPGLGCRILVKNNFSKILPALLKELGDWTSEIRLKSASLLYQLILHEENNVTLHLGKVLTGMYNAANDEEEEVVRQVEKSAELIGCFVPPHVYCSIILPTIECSPTSGHMLILASILRASTKSTLATELVPIGNMLNKPPICRNMKSDFQRQLIKCCDALLLVCSDDCCSISSQLFRITVTVFGLTSDIDITHECDGVLNQLRDLEKCPSDLEFYDKFMGPLLEELSHTAGNWFLYSPERLIFETLLKKSGAAIGYHWKCISQIIVTALKPGNDPEVKLKLLTIVSNIFTTNEDALKLLPNPSSSLFVMIQEAVFPNLEWSAGRTASSIRTAAVSCLFSCLSYRESLALDLISFGPLYFTTLLSLVEDDSVITRELTLSCLCQIFEKCSDKLNVDEVNKASEVIIKRLDDVSDTVRMISMRAIMLLFSKLPSDYDITWHRTRIISIYSAVLIHLDDSDEQFTGAVLETLKNLGNLLPRELYEKVAESKNNFRNVGVCEDLLQYLKGLNVCH